MIYSWLQQNDVFFSNTSTTKLFIWSRRNSSETNIWNRQIASLFSISCKLKQFHVWILVKFFPLFYSKSHVLFIFTSKIQVNLSHNHFLLPRIPIRNLATSSSIRSIPTIFVCCIYCNKCWLRNFDIFLVIDKNILPLVQFHHDN